MARGRKQRRIRRAEDQVVDRITELPFEIRAHILDYLSVADAIATSVLSSQWRSTWTGLKYLKFDEHFLKRASKDPHPNKIIDKVLALHSGPIDLFHLTIPSPKRMELVGDFAWLRVLANRGVKVIDIDALDYSLKLPMPSSLFECRELEGLILAGFCKVKVPMDFQGFPNLVNISFDNVSIKRNELEDLISKCPMLEHLTIDDSDFGKIFVLKAPNLKSFTIDDGMWSSIDIDFEDVRKLSRVSLLATELDIDYVDDHNALSCRRIEWLRPLSGIEDLTFDCLLLRASAKDIPKRSPTPFRNLKWLTLKSVNPSNKYDVLLTLCLLESAPVLQHLTIHLRSNSVHPFPNKIRSKRVKKWWAEVLRSEGAERIISIQSVKILGAVGRPNERCLIKILKRRCRNVKKFIVEKK